MRVPNLDAEIYRWEVENLRWRKYAGTLGSDYEACVYCHKEKHEHTVETDSDGIEYYICLNYPYTGKANAYP